jgi:hypothetical protein
MARRHLNAPRSYRCVDDVPHSSLEKYSCAYSMKPCMVWPPQPKSLASDAIRIDNSLVGGQIGPPNLSLGSPFQKRSSLIAPSINTTQQFNIHTELIKAYMCLV